jgi:hypothetical protein
MPFDPNSSFLSPSVLYQSLLSLNIVLAILAVLLLFIIPLHKLSVERRARRHRELFDAYGKAFRGLGSSEFTLAPPSVPLEYEAFADSAAEVIREVDGNPLLRDFVRSQNVVIAYYTKQLSSRAWVRRFSAAERLGGLQLFDLKPVLSAALRREKDVRVISRLVWGMSFTADRDSVAIINAILTDPHFMSSKFSEFIYCNILRAFKQRNQEHDLAVLLGTLLNAPELPVMLKRDIIQACGNEGFDDAEKLVLEAFERFHDVPEMKMAIIRTINRLQLAKGQRVLISSLQDDDWRIRSVAAKDIQVNSSAIFSLLEKLLCDDNYIVRFNSAVSLSSAGILGREILQLSFGGDDRFARDISGYVLRRYVRI